MPTLSVVACRNAKPALKPRKLSDGGGLYLLIQPTGGKLWRLAYRFGGKQKTLAFGAFPVVSLGQAREYREEAKRELVAGRDPGEVRKAAKASTKLAAANTFEAVAREWFEGRRAGWVPSYSERLLRRLEADMFPSLGPRPIAVIEAPEVLHAVRRIEERGAVEMAKRVLQATGQVFRYAIATGRARRDPTQDLKGALRSAAPPKHRAALRAVELPAFLREIEGYKGDLTTKLALKFVLHTFVRTSEARFARWSEFEDLHGPAPLWRIPADRMKARTEHLVPLSPHTIDLLDQLMALSSGSGFVFPSASKSRVISENTLIYAIYRLGYHSRLTVHGFRGMASTILNEHGFNRDWIERQLAHVERNAVRAAYNSAEWLGDRRRMMEWWSNYLADAAMRAATKDARPARQASSG